eukprot:superscaffoldBa00009829_g24335
MFSFHMFLYMLAVTLLTVTAESSSGGGGRRTYNYDLSGSDLTRLYNSPVYHAEKMERPAKGSSGPISYSGVRVTLEDGSLWLIHKGGRVGKDSRTVVTDARHMSSAWQSISTREFE